jgi:hypothetical protein
MVDGKAGRYNTAHLDANHWVDHGDSLGSEAIGLPGCRREGMKRCSL